MPLFFASAALASTSSSSILIPVIVSGISAIGGVIGGYALKEKLEKDVPEFLEALREQRRKLIGERLTGLDVLITDTDKVVLAAMEGINTQQKEIKKHTNTLKNEATMVADVNVQLLDVTTLLEKIGKAMDEDSRPLIEALKKRLNTLSMTEEELQKTRDSLTDTADELQLTLNKHKKVQASLKAKVSLDKKTISHLERSLSKALKTLSEIKDSDLGERVTKLSEENRQLKEQLAKAKERELAYRKNLHTAKQMLSAKDQQIKAMSSHSGAGKRQMEEGERKTPSMKMFA